MSRFPHTVKLPEVVWLGMVSGQWPIRAFGDEAQAAAWANASDDEGRKKYVWRIEVPVDAPVYEPVHVPAKNTLVPYREVRDGKA